MNSHFRNSWNFTFIGLILFAFLYVSTSSAQLRAKKWTRKNNTHTVVPIDSPRVRVERPKASRGRSTALSLDALKNATYYLDCEDDPVALQNGTADHMRFERHWGMNLDKDNKDDAIVELSCFTGGTTRYYYLVPVLNKDYTPLPLRAYKIPYEKTDIVSVVFRFGFFYITIIIHEQDINGSPVTRREEWKFAFKKNNYLERIQ